jgi:hypothetical protein
MTTHSSGLSIDLISPRFLAQVFRIAKNIKWQLPFTVDIQQRVGSQPERLRRADEFARGQFGTRLEAK